MRVLVTGGAGFIGSHLVDRLLRDGHDVRVLDNFSTGRRENLLDAGPDVELVEGDIRSYERALTAIKGCGAVLHQAAIPSVPRSIQDPLTTHEVNATGTLNVLLAARDHDVRRVVVASSSSVYGASEMLPKREEMPALPISPYAVSKLAGEGLCRSFHCVYGLETIALRYFNVFGPRQDPTSQYSAVIPNFISAALREERPVVYGDGEQSRDFTYVSNVVEANVLAMRAPDVGGGVFNIACGERITLNGVLEAVTAATGVSIEPVHQRPRGGDVKHSVADITSARDRLGYGVDVDFSSGLARTIEHYDTRASLEASAAPNRR